MSGLKFLVVLSTTIGVVGGLMGSTAENGWKEKLLLFLIVGTICLMFTVIAGALILVNSKNPNALIW